MATTNIILAGFGGQGILFAGKVIAYAGLMEGKEVSWLPSYGPEMRGGTANCSVCVSDEMVASPLVINPDILIAMNTPSFEKFIDALVPGGIAIVDSSLVDAKTDIHLFQVPATQLANEKGLKGLANIILVGKMMKESGFVSLDGIYKGIDKSVPAKKAHLAVSNKQAVELGMSL